MKALTNIEAISAIKNNMPTKGTYTILTEALGMAIEALGKEKPMEYSLKSYKDEDGWVTGYYICSACEKQIHHAHKYCPTCGQKIDWSEEE